MYKCCFVVAAVALLLVQCAQNSEATKFVVSLSGSVAGNVYFNGSDGSYRLRAELTSGVAMDQTYDLLKLPKTKGSCASRTTAPTLFAGFWITDSNSDGSVLIGEAATSASLSVGDIIILRDGDNNYDELGCAVLEKQT